MTPLEALKARMMAQQAAPAPLLAVDFAEAPAGDQRVTLPESVVLRLGDSLEILRDMPDNSLDALVTDPPAGINFMGKSWDRFLKGREGFIESLEAIFLEALRVLKPGAYGLVWSLPRTSHWTAMAVENAGFFVCDKIAHFYGQGFPKNHDIAKAIQKQSGVQPIGEKPPSLGMANNPQWNALHRQLVMPDPEGVAALWEGWGTALKPAREDWILVQKPISERTIAANVLRWGTGGINIDGCRIPGDTPSQDRRKSNLTTGTVSPGGWTNRTSIDRYQEDRPGEALGRYPANITFDEEAAALLDAQTGDLASGVAVRRNGKGGEFFGKPGQAKFRAAEEDVGYGDSGGASRFFYVAKPSRREKEAGCEHLTAKTAAELTGRQEGSAGLVAKHTDGSDKANPYAGTSGAKPRKNHHPTVKPIDLMRYYVRLITPPNGIVLDPFLGSGTTGCAAVLEGFGFVGIEKQEDYLLVAEARIAHAARGDAT